MPFARVISMLKVKAAQNGIRIVEQEESYTSKASYLDGDLIPVFGEENAQTTVFSGKRKPTVYKGSYWKDGSRISGGVIHYSEIIQTLFCNPEKSARAAF